MAGLTQTAALGGGLPIGLLMALANRQTQPVAQKAPTTTPTSQPLDIATLLSYFRGNTPTSNPATVGGIPAAQATPYAPATVDPTAFSAQILKSLAPQFAQQDKALQESLASAGIVGGSSPGAFADLGAQQEQTALGEIAPLQAGMLQGNQTATNTAAQDFVNNLLSAALANQSTANQAGQYNATQENAAQQFDISNAINSGMYDTSTYNQMLQYLLGLQNQDWLAQYGANANLAASGASGQTSAFEPIYQQPAASNGLSTIGSALASRPTINYNPAGTTGTGGYNSSTSGIP